MSSKEREPSPPSEAELLIGKWCFNLRGTLSFDETLQVESRLKPFSEELEQILTLPDLSERDSVAILLLRVLSDSRGDSESDGIRQMLIRLGVSESLIVPKGETLCRSTLADLLFKDEIQNINLFRHVLNIPEATLQELIADASKREPIDPMAMEGDLYFPIDFEDL